jgi:hypothetical protein
MLIKISVDAYSRLHTTLYLCMHVVLCSCLEGCSSALKFSRELYKDKDNKHTTLTASKTQSAEYLLTMCSLLYAIMCTCIYSLVYIVYLLCNECALLLLCVTRYTTVFGHVKRC